MNARVTAIVAATLLLTACTSDTDSGGQALPATTTQPTTTTPPPVDLREALLDVTDLPPGFTEDPQAQEEEPPTSCKELNAFDELDVPKGDKATASWTQASTGTFVTEELVRAGEQRATKTMDTVAGAIDACPTFTLTIEEGTLLEARLTELSLPTFGDDTFAAQFTGQVQEVTIQAHLVLIRSGEILIAITNLGQTADSTLTQQVTQAAVAELQDAS